MNPWMRLIEVRWRLRVADGSTLECSIYRLAATEYEVRMASGDEITGDLGSARYLADILKKAMFVEHPEATEVALIAAM